MGTTESIFSYDDKPPDPRPGSNHHSNPQQRPAPRRIPVSSQQQQRSNIHDQRPLKRLKAQIWGLPESGKHSLLQRLQGKDPFVETTAAGDSAAAAAKKQPQTALVPYHAPAGLEVWDRIQLHVQVVAVETDNNPDDSSPIDFTVLLVDPRHDRDRIQQHLSGSIDAMLKRQGYEKVAHGVETPRTVRGNDKSTSQLKDEDEAMKRPFCVCLVLNFYDQLAAAKSKNGSNHHHEVISESDLQHMTMELLQDYTGLEPRRMLLQCTTTSLRDCYGLAQLHHFIYQSYLIQREWTLQCLLRQVQEASWNCRQSLPPMVSYEEYHAQLVRGHAGSKNTTTDSNEQRSKKKEQSRKKERKSSKSSSSKKGSRRKDEDTSSRDESSLPSSIQQGSRRNVLPASVTVTRRHASEEEEDATTETTTATASLDPKSALEAFLAEDDDDDDNGRIAVGTNDNSSDDDDDDDFFYDESGQRFQSKRRQHPIKATVSHPNKSSDTGSVDDSNKLDADSSSLNKNKSTDRHETAGSVKQARNNPTAGADTGEKQESIERNGHDRNADSEQQSADERAVTVTQPEAGTQRDDSKVLAVSSQANLSPEGRNKQRAAATGDKGISQSSASLSVNSSDSKEGRMEETEVLVAQDEHDAVPRTTTESTANTEAGTSGEEEEEGYMAKLSAHSTVAHEQSIRNNDMHDEAAKKQHPDLQRGDNDTDESCSHEDKSSPPDDRTHEQGNHDDSPTERVAVVHDPLPKHDLEKQTSVPQCLRSTPEVEEEGNGSNELEDDEEFVVESSPLTQNKEPNIDPQSKDKDSSNDRQPDHAVEETKEAVAPQRTTAVSNDSDDDDEVFFIDNECESHAPEQTASVGMDQNTCNQTPATSDSHHHPGPSQSTTQKAKRKPDNRTITEPVAATAETKPTGLSAAALAAIAAAQEEARLMLREQQEERQNPEQEAAVAKKAKKKKEKKEKKKKKTIRSDLVDVL